MSRQVVTLGARRSALGARTHQGPEILCGRPDLSGRACHRIAASQTLGAERASAGVACVTRLHARPEGRAYPGRENLRSRCVRAPTPSAQRRAPRAPSAERPTRAPSAERPAPSRDAFRPRAPYILDGCVPREFTAGDSPATLPRFPPVRQAGAGGLTSHRGGMRDGEERVGPGTERRHRPERTGHGTAAVYLDADDLSGRGQQPERRDGVGAEGDLSGGRAARSRRHLTVRPGCHGSQHAVLPGAFGRRAARHRRHLPHPARRRAARPRLGGSTGGRRIRAAQHGSWHPRPTTCWCCRVMAVGSWATFSPTVRRVGHRPTR